VISPLVLRTFGVRHLRIVGDELVAQTRTWRDQDAKTRLQLVLDSYSASLRLELKQAETVLKIQALEVDRCLQQNTSASADTSVLSSANLKNSMTGSANKQELTILPGFPRGNAAADMLRMSKMASVYQKLSSPLFLRQQTLLTNGLLSVYPAASVPDGSMDPRAQRWFQHALEGYDGPRFESGEDPVTGQLVITVSMPVRRSDGRIAGATAVVLPVMDLLEKHKLVQQWPVGIRVFLVRFTQNRQTRNAGLEIVAEYGKSGGSFKDRRTGFKSRWLTSGPEKQFRAMEGELRKYTVEPRRMPFEGRDSLWAARSINYPYVLVSISPYETILKPAVRIENFVNQLIDEQSRYSLYVLLAMTLTAIVLAGWFSRTVTRPLRTLTQGVRHLTAGHFHARVDIRSRDEFGELGRVFNTLGPLLEEHVRVARLMALATEVQSYLLPQSDPEVPGLDVSGSCIYCDRVGGDYYDYLLVGERRQGKFGVVVGDVAGHGISAALVMSTARALLHQRASFPGCIDCDLSDINRHLYRDIGESGRFMTLFYCEFDTREKNLHWVRAGHDPAIVYNPHTGGFDELYGQGMALGVFENVDYIENQYGLLPGQIYVFGTDGLLETRNIKGESFGKERLREIVRAQADKSAKEIKEAMLKAVHNFRGSQKQEDDITLVIVKAGY
jgi:sigma-B regulation protein RsbU (phosphoserine phosphatase)